MALRGGTPLYRCLHRSAFLPQSHAANGTPGIFFYFKCSKFFNETKLSITVWFAIIRESNSERKNIRQKVVVTYFTRKLIASTLSAKKQHKNASRLLRYFFVVFDVVSEWSAPVAPRKRWNAQNKVFFGTEPKGKLCNWGKFRGSLA